MHMITKCALAGCATLMVAGCASQRNSAPQYRLSTPSTHAVEGVSMLQRGRAQLDAGLEALAIESFRAEIRFNPEQADAYNGLGVAYGRIGRNDLAQRYFEVALSKDPANIRVQANLNKLPRSEQNNSRLAEISPTVKSPEPAAVTVDADDQSTSKLAIDFDLTPPVNTLAQLEMQTEPPGTEILGRRGILSSRFTMATAKMTMNTKRRTSALTLAPAIPNKLPMPEPEVPTPYIQNDLRAGSRLERVSMNEVRLITRSVNSPQRPPSGPTFQSFGDRLALWLPAYMSAEQAASRYSGDEKVLVMAVPQGANSANVTVVPVRLSTELPDFAYIGYKDDNDLVGT